MIELKQKIVIEERNFKLTDEGLEMFCDDIEGKNNSVYAFDEFSNETRDYTEKFPKLIYFGVLLLLAGYIRTAILIDKSFATSLLSGQLLAGLGAVLILIYYFYQVDYKLLCLDNEKQVFIIADKPSKEEVLEFIKTFYEMRKTNYRNRYFKINFENEKEKEIDRMKWLRKEEIITDNEFEFMLEEIQIKFL